MTNPPFKQNPFHTSVSLRRAIFTACILVCIPLAAQALSLGRSRGAVLLGQPLNLSVLASVEPQEETPELACFVAEVFYGDNRVNAQNVFLSVARSSPTEVTLRVQANSKVDEPVVTVYVKAGCNFSSSRRYVLLPDAPSEPAPAGVFSPPVSIPLGPPVPPRPVSQAAAASTDDIVRDTLSAERRAALSQARAERRAARRAEQPKAVAKPKPVNPKNRPAVPKAVPKPSEKLSGKSRLKLDLLDLTSIAEPSLRASAEMLTLPSTDNATRDKAAALWRAINSQPEDVLRDSQRLLTMETSLRSMQDTSKRQMQELNTLKTDLTSAQQQRYANPLVYALGALALGALGWAISLFRQRRNTQSPWWGSVSRSNTVDSMHSAGKSSGTGGLQIDGVPLDHSPVYPSSNKSGWQNDSRQSTASAAANQLTSSFSTANGGTQQPQPSAEAVDSRPVAWRDSLSASLAASNGAAPRAVNAEELFDIQQQADFFLSLGQHDQAIDILQNHISENVETSALAYLDLFNIYHQVGKREEYDMLRSDFNMVFNAQVPSFEDYDQNSRGLEEYDAALSRIQELWPSPMVLEVIEESIFRKPEHDGQPFDLLAYRELMLLYAIAKDMTDQSDGDAIDPTQRHTEIQPLPGLVSDRAKYPQPNQASHLSTQPVQPLAPMDIEAAGLDIDLDIFGNGPSAAPAASLPAVLSATDKPAAQDSGSIDFDLPSSSQLDSLKPK